MKIQVANPVDVAKRAFFLAYQASLALGLGRLRAREGATEEDVCNNIAVAGDYDSNLHQGKDYIHADYVFGRMMKLTLRIHPDGVEVPDREPKADYQGWAAKYPTYAGLIEAAVQDLARQGVEAQ